MHYIDEKNQQQQQLELNQKQGKIEKVKNKPTRK